MLQLFIVEHHWIVDITIQLHVKVKINGLSLMIVMSRRVLWMNLEGN